MRASAPWAAAVLWLLILSHRMPLTPARLLQCWPTVCAAAALGSGYPQCMLSAYPPAAVLADPMCGSGTFLIEAALMATGTAPGSFRRWWPFTQASTGAAGLQRRMRCLDSGACYGCGSMTQLLWRIVSPAGVHIDTSLSPYPLTDLSLGSSPFPLCPAVARQLRPWHLGCPG